LLLVYSILTVKYETLNIKAQLHVEHVIAAWSWLLVPSLPRLEYINAPHTKSIVYLYSSLHYEHWLSMSWITISMVLRWWRMYVITSFVAWTGSIYTSCRDWSGMYMRHTCVHTKTAWNKWIAWNTRQQASLNLFLKLNLPTYTNCLLLLSSLLCSVLKTVLAW